VLPAEPVEPAPAEVAALPAPAPTLTAPADFIFESSRRNAGPLFLSGVVPADATRRYFAVIAGNVPAGGLSISTTLPPDFIPSADAGLRALTELFNGELGYDGARWYLTGTADTPDRRTAALNGIMALPNAAAWTTDIGLTPPSDLCGRTVATFTSSHSILFQSGSARMTEDSAASLAELATSLSECPETPIWVEGHTDADGPDDLNLALSVSRAEAVVEALTTLGVDSGRLYAVGYGESLPIASNDTSDGKRANRRIVFSVVEE
jgi:OOP family OmpA-OmpF porin